MIRSRRRRWVRRIATGVGTVPADPGYGVFEFEGTAGTLVDIFIDADTSTTGVPNPDLTFYLLDPDGNQIAFVDTGTNPESLTLELPLNGTYSVLVVGGTFGALGDYLYRVQQVEIVQQVLSDYNLLLFLTNGTYIGAIAEQNLFTNRPLELFGLNTGGGTVNLQMVVARANVPNAKKRDIADRIRYVGFGTLSPQEYFSYLGPVTYGHNSAEGSMGVAAYAFYAPFIPEKLHVTGTFHDLLRHGQSALQEAADPTEAGPSGDGRCQHDVFLQRRIARYG